MNSRHTFSFLVLVFSHAIFFSADLSASWINGTLSVDDRAEEVSASVREMKKACDHAINQVETAYQEVGRELDLRCEIYGENFWGDIEYTVYTDWSSTEMPIQCAEEQDLRYAEFSIDDRFLVMRFTFDKWLLGDKAIWKKGFFSSLHALGEIEELGLDLVFSKHILDRFFDVRPDPIGFRVPYCN